MDVGERRSEAKKDLIGKSKHLGIAVDTLVDLSLMCGGGASSRLAMIQKSVERLTAYLEGRPTTVGCTDCDKVYTERSTLARHRRAAHRDPADEKACPDCGEMFVNVAVHRRHKHPVVAA